MNIDRQRTCEAIAKANAKDRIKDPNCDIFVIGMTEEEIEWVKARQGYYIALYNELKP